jgi:hypothetical protein
MILKVRERMRLVLRVGELLRELGEALKLGELPLLLQKRVTLLVVVVEIDVVKLNHRIESLGFSRNVREDCGKPWCVWELADREAAMKSVPKRSVRTRLQETRSLTRSG